jgi:DNA mismatch repair protein MutL
VASHATSKLRTADELFAVRTLGFRGEALASIASVSRLHLRSRSPERIEAAEIVATDAATDGPRPCAGPPGTTVEVRNLFFNVPARRKFLRRAATEFGHCNEQVARLALAHPGVAMTLTHDGRSARNVPACEDRRGRIADFYGPELAACLLAVDRQERGLRLEALIAPPAQSRGSTKWQYLFLNGRYIVDRRVGFAIREAYRGLVEHDRYPVVFIFLSMDPSGYDVNVHPTKIEVRWQDAGLVQSQVLAVLRETLLSHDLTPRFDLDRAPRGGDDARVTDDRHSWGARRALADYLKSIDPTQARLGFQPPPFASRHVRPSIVSTFAPALRGIGAGPSDDALPGGGAASDRSGESVDSRDRSLGPGTSPAQQGASDRGVEAGDERTAAVADDEGGAVLQVHNTYLVAQTADGMVIIDQHALHERILYERFRDRVLAGPLESQRLLMPQTFGASPAQVEAVEAQGALLGQLGIEIAPFGPRTLAVQSFPVLLSGVDPLEFVGDLLDLLAEPGGVASEESGGEASRAAGAVASGDSADDASRAADGAAAPDGLEKLLHRLLDMMACKAAVKAGDPLTVEEMRALLSQRHLVDRSSNCPHGRPTTLQLSTRDLERQFKRV